MNYIKKIILFLFTIFGLTSNGQIIGTNLVQNPSFEDYYQCPLNFNQLNLAKYWWGYSADYYNACETTNLISVPANLLGFQNAKTGVAYAGFILYGNNPNISSNYTYTETIKNQLKDSLFRNKRYCINYYISMIEITNNFAIANNSLIFYDSISAMFSINQVNDVLTPLMCNSCAKFSKSISTIDTLNWLKISGSVIANGGEKYLTIGKFYNINWPPNNIYQFSIYIDDVSVCECAYNINLGPDAKLCEGDKMILNPNLPNATYTWQDSSHAATYEVKQPGTYWVRAYVAEYGITTSDTIIITAEKEEICNPPLVIPNFITPNGDGANDYFHIGNADKYELSLQIFNRWGKLIYQQDHYQNDYNGNSTASGVYYYLLTAKSLRNTQLKEYKGCITVLK